MNRTESPGLELDQNPPGKGKEKKKREKSQECVKSSSKPFDAFLKA